MGLEQAFGVELELREGYDQESWQSVGLESVNMAASSHRLIFRVTVWVRGWGVYVGARLRSGLE